MSQQQTCEDRSLPQSVYDSATLTLCNPWVQGETGAGSGGTLKQREVREECVCLKVVALHLTYLLVKCMPCILIFVGNMEN